MIKFKNMKIEVNSNLDDIVAELVKKGYWISSRACNSNQAWCFDDGRVLLVDGKSGWGFHQCVDTTLAELKEMGGNV